MLARTRPLPLTVAGGVLVIAAIAYVALIALAIPNGSVYLTALGGSEPTPLGTVVVVYGALAVIAGFLARQLLRRPRRPPGRRRLRRVVRGRGARRGRRRTDGGLRYRVDRPAAARARLVRGPGRELNGALGAQSPARSSMR